jgi:FtsH-binding integral membrane protein
MSDQEIKAILELPKSGLIVREKAVVKTSGENTVIGKHSFEDIQRVAVLSKTDSFCVALCLGTLAGAVVSKMFIPNQTAAWVVCLIMGLAFLIFMASIKKTVICIETKHGSVEYDVVETSEEGQGFVLSVQSLVSRVHKTAEESKD